jgi:hypothetical protein
MPLSWWAGHEARSKTAPVARCRAAWHASGLPVCVMDLIEQYPGPTSDLPSWAGLVDQYQVGLDGAGKWVVYDASHTHAPDSRAKALQLADELGITL